MRTSIGHPSRGIIVLATMALSACSAPPSAASVQLGDTTFVASAEPLLGTARLREVMRIGELDGRPEYMFARVSMLAVGNNGDIFVAEIDGDLRQYDHEGTFVRTVGQKGQGPGEVEYVVGMDVAPDGRLGVVDFGNQRISIYSQDGEFIRQVRRPAGRPGYGRDALRWDEQGEIWIAVHPPRSGPDTLGAGARPLYGRLIEDGVVTDTVFLPRRAWNGCERRQIEYSGGYFEDARIPLMPFAQWGLSPSRALAFGCSGRYEIDVVRPGGVTRISRQWDPPRMSGEEHEYHTNDTRNRLRDNVTVIPRERPAFLRVWIDDEERVWTWRGAPGASTELSPEARRAFERVWRGAPVPERTWRVWSATDGFDLFSPTGEWLGHVVTPDSWGAGPFPGNRDPEFKGDTIWAVTRDEFDVTYISKFVLEWDDPPAPAGGS